MEGKQENHKMHEIKKIYPQDPYKVSNNLAWGSIIIFIISLIIIVGLVIYLGMFSSKLSRH